MSIINRIFSFHTLLFVINCFTVMSLTAFANIKTFIGLFPFHTNEDYSDFISDLHATINEITLLFAIIHCLMSAQNEVSTC